MGGIKLSNRLPIIKPEDRVREYCRVEIPSGYDNCHEVNNTITSKNISAANRLSARISKVVAERIIQSENVRNALAVIDNRDIGEINKEEWSVYKEKLYNLLTSFCSIKGVGIAVATKILHLKRPKLIPILDSFVVKFLLEIDTQVMNKSYFPEVGIKCIEVIREDIRRDLEAFTRLQERLSNLPIPLSKVRLWDILAWSTEKWDIRGDLKAPFGMPHESIRRKIYEIDGNYESKDKKNVNDIIWINVDKPTKKCTIHTNLGCQYLAKKSDTPYKGVEKLKRDGGWLSFSTLTDGENYCKTKHQNYSVSWHC